MMVEFVCNPLPPVSIEWGNAPVPDVGHILLWKLNPGGFVPGKYRVGAVEWVVAGDIFVRITIYPS